LRSLIFSERIAQDRPNLPGPWLCGLIEGIDRTYLRPKTHPAVSALILIDLDIHSARNTLMAAKDLYPSHRAIRETSLTADAPIITNLHKKPPFRYHTLKPW
jgi:hypothetical protein